MATCTYTVPDKSATSDNFCHQAFVDYFWNTYGFSGNKVYWDGGLGWDDCCNTNKPLARAFNGCYALLFRDGLPERQLQLTHPELGAPVRPRELGHEGAWMYGALYLWWYYAAGARTTSALRERARQRGNVVIDNAFANPSGLLDLNRHRRVAPSITARRSGTSRPAEPARRGRG